MSLDRQIRDVMDVFGLLMVFVAALLSFVMSRAAEHKEADRPDVRADRVALAAKVSGMMRLAVALLIMIGSVLAVSIGTFWKTLQTFAFGDPISPLRTGFAILNAFLVLAGLWTFFTAQDLARKARELGDNDASR